MRTYPHILMGAVFLLSGCLPVTPNGNADGYSGHKDTGSVKMAYVVDATASCSANGLNETGFTHVIKMDGGVASVRAACELDATEIPSTDLQVLDDVVAAYQGKLFEFLESPPQPKVDDPVLTAWCRTTDQVGNRALGFTIKTILSTRVNFASVYTKVGEDFTESDYFSVAIERHLRYRTLTSEPLQASIRTTLADIVLNVYPGFMTVPNPGFEGVHPMQCFLVLKNNEPI